jgi:hypothetical protein
MTKIFTLIKKRNIILPFRIEGDSHGHSALVEEEEKIFWNNWLDGKLISHNEISEERAREIIRETLDERG